ncbi:hypothetical protein A2U01_0103116, partial [Trifolium medium]|nr:hypothetical protein [Trifolium medium]
MVATRVGELSEESSERLRWVTKVTRSKRWPSIEEDSVSRRSIEVEKRSIEVEMAVG